MKLSIERIALWGILCGGCLVTLLLVYDFKGYFDSMHRAGLKKHSHRVFSRSQMQDEDAVHVCMCADAHSVLGTIAAMNSVQVNTNHHVVFHVFVTSDIMEHVKAWLSQPVFKNVSYDLIEFDTSLIRSVITVREARKELANAMNYARYYYPSLLMNVEGLVVHLDSDCIVQGDIKDLVDIELRSDQMIAVVGDCTSLSKRFENFPPVYNSYINFAHPDVRNLNISPSACAFNVGMYVVDLTNWRNYNITRQLEFWLEKNSREPVYGIGVAGGGSQPPMMLALYNRTKLINDPLWHVRGLGLQAAKRISPSFLNHGKILHWSGPMKPWDARGYFKPFWMKYYVPDPLGKYVPVSRGWAVKK